MRMDRLEHVYAVECTEGPGNISYQDLFTNAEDAERDAKWLTLQADGARGWRVVRFVRDEGGDDE